MRVVSLRVDRTVRSPWQVGHGSSMIDPVPWQLAHGSENANDPWLRVVSPLPWQTGHSRGAVPGLAPMPWQVGQVARSVMPSGTVTPLTASAKPIRTSVSRSAPFCARIRVPPGAPAPPRLNSPPNRSPRPPAPPHATRAAALRGVAEQVAHIETTGTRRRTATGAAAAEAAERTGGHQVPRLVVLLALLVSESTS